MRGAFAMCWSWCRSWSAKYHIVTVQRRSLSCFEMQLSGFTPLSCVLPYHPVCQSTQWSAGRLTSVAYEL